MKACPLRVRSDDLQVADLGATLRFLHALVFQEGWQLPDALQFMTTNAARVLQLPNKGQVQLAFCQPPSITETGWLSTCFGNQHGCDR